MSDADLAEVLPRPPPSPPFPTPPLLLLSPPFTPHTHTQQHTILPLNLINNTFLSPSLPLTRYRFEKRA